MANRSVVLISPYRTSPQGVVVGPNGSALDRYTREFARALCQRRCDVRVVGPRGNDARTWSDGDIRIVPGYKRGHALSFAQLTAAVHRQPAAVVHLQHELFAYGGIASAFGLPFGMRSLRRSGRHIVTTLHGVIPLDKIDDAFVKNNAVVAPTGVVRHAWRYLIRSVCRESDVVHVHEAEHATWLRGQYGVDCRIEVQAIGADTSSAAVRADDSRAELAIPSDAQVLLFFGYLLERKGIVPFLKAVPELLERNPKLFVVVAGTVPERVARALDIGATLTSLSAHGRFRPLGYISDERVASIYAAADVLILPYTFSMSASAPFALALGYRTPVLLSNVFRSSYPDAPTFFDPAPSSIVAAVHGFFNNAGERRRAGNYVRMVASRRSWATTAERMIEVYQSLPGLVTRTSA